MTVIEAIALVLRRCGHAAGALVFALILGALVATGFFAPLGPFAADPDAAGAGTPWSRIVVLGLWAAVFGWRALERFRDSRQARRRSLARDVELGLLLVVAAYAAVQLTGGVGGPLYPLVYVLVAFLVSFLGWRPVLIVVGAALGLEAALVLLPGTPGAWHTLAAHGAFIASFAVLNAVFTRSEIARLRVSGKQQLEEKLSEAERTARDFRLLAAPSTSCAEGVAPEEQGQRRMLSAVMELRQSIYFSLDLLKRSLDLHTAALLWLDHAGRLKIAELASDSDDIAEGPFDTSPGVLGAALACGRTVNLHHLRGQLAHIPYYKAPGRVGCLLAVPVQEGGTTRGVLCADRLNGDDAFGEREEEALRAAARHVVQAAENERVFVALEQAKAEQTKLYKASEVLGAAHTEDEAIDAVLGAARGIALFDFAAITLYDPETGRHRVVRAQGEGAEGIEGLTFSDNAGLASMAVKNRHYLPYRGQFDARRQVVYTRSARLKGMESLLILPLISQELPLGTLTLAAQEANVFTDTIRRTLQVLTNQMATSISNARMVRRLKEMATTDGLTGLLNHRVFQEELEKKLKSAERFGHSLSVIITDLDKFKSVNDTYGHPVGDVVLKGFAAVLGSAMRETDLVARYGGEEFAIICEQTDAPGALLLADRIREEMAARVFQAEIGQFQVTCSLGIATFPTHAKDKQALVESADQALYAAKEKGRNRAEVFSGGPGAHAHARATARARPCESRPPARGSSGPRTSPRPARATGFARS
jgi:diguanylate cyclase (GGDEF)-like protein